MACRRKTKGERELIADINKRFKVFCNESYDLEGIGCMNCELNFEDEESCEIQYIKMLMGKDEQINIEEINGAIKEIADTFKIRNQQLKLIEELGELTREISKDIANGRKISDDTISEIADVNILINQILYLSSNKDYSSKEKLKEHIEYKLQRTIQRINIGYYK